MVLEMRMNGEKMIYLAKGSYVQKDWLSSLVMIII